MKILVIYDVCNYIEGYKAAEKVFLHLINKKENCGIGVSAHRLIKKPEGPIRIYTFADGDSLYFMRSDQYTIDLKEDYQFLVGTNDSIAICDKNGDLIYVKSPV